MYQRSFTTQQRLALSLDLLILPLTCVYLTNQSRALFDTICNATGAAPATTHIQHYPCDEPNTLSRFAYLAARLPSTLLSYVSATHPSTGSHPNEIRPLCGICVILACTVFLVACPRLFLQWRSWLWMCVSCVCTAVPCVGLLTHPLAPPSSYWANYLPFVGLMMHCELMIFRIEGRAARAHVASYCLFTLASSLLLPAVYPGEVRVPWFTIPLLAASVLFFLRGAARPPRCNAEPASTRSRGPAPSSAGKGQLGWEDAGSVVAPPGTTGLGSCAPGQPPASAASPSDTAGKAGPPTACPSSSAACRRLCAGSRGGADSPTAATDTQGAVEDEARSSGGGSGVATSGGTSDCGKRVCGMAGGGSGSESESGSRGGGGSSGGGSGGGRGGESSGSIRADTFQPGRAAPLHIPQLGSADQPQRESSVAACETPQPVRPCDAADDTEAGAVHALPAARRPDEPQASVKASAGECVSTAAAELCLVRPLMLAMQKQPYVSKVGAAPLALGALGCFAAPAAIAASAAIAAAAGALTARVRITALLSSPPSPHTKPHTHTVQAKRYRVVTKIPHMEPHQLPPDFLQLMAQSLSQHPTHPSMIVGVAIRRGCIELSLDLVHLCEAGRDPADAGPTQHGFLDPEIWLHHLHVLPPPGTEVLTQACGRVWKSTWDDSLDPPRWVLSPFPLPLGKLPRLLRAPGVLLLRRTPTPTALTTTTTTSIATSNNTPAAAAAHRPHAADGPVLNVEVGIFGVVPDIGVRSCGSYLEAASVMQERAPGQGGRARSEDGASRVFSVTLTGPLPGRGLLMLESKLGWMVSDSTPLLLTDDADIAAEVERLLGCGSSMGHLAGRQASHSQSTCVTRAGHTREDRAEHHDFIIDLGSWFSYVDSVCHDEAATATAEASVAHRPPRAGSAGPPCFDAKTAPSSIYLHPAMSAHMAQTGISLLVACVGKACPHTAGAIMQGLLSLGRPYPWVLAQCQAETPGRMTLLQHAQASGCAASVRLVMDLNRQHGAPGPASDCAVSVTRGSGDSGSGDSGSGDSGEGGCSRSGSSGSSGSSAGGSAAKASPVDDGGSLAKSIMREHSAACDALFSFSDAAAAALPPQAQPGFFGSQLLAPTSAHPLSEQQSACCSILAKRKGSTSLDWQWTDVSATGTTQQQLQMARISSAQLKGNWASNAPVLIGGAGVSVLGNAQAAAAAAAAAGPSYRLWLSRRSAVHTNQFYIILFVMVVFVTVRRLWEGNSVDAASAALLAFHVARMVGSCRSPGWFLQHSESLNVVWQLLNEAVKIAALTLGWPYIAGPPLPYLLCFDWVVEGVLPTLCAQRGGGNSQ
ncbi:MAG: hypothetical protein WDW36_000257 [Sanguina aurantia]